MTTIKSPRRRRRSHIWQRTASVVVTLSAGLVATPVAAQDWIGRIDRVFAYFDRPGSPGCAVGVMRGGSLTVKRGYGEADLSHRIPITSTTVFRTGSLSKQFTAAAVLRAVRDGHFSLDDDVRTYVPELPPYERAVTIRHLLNHTSGLRDYLTLMYLTGKRRDDFYTGADVLAVLARQRELNFSPGSQYLYSNSGYLLLSEIIHRTTGRTLREFAAEHVFAPLGMTSTHFHDDHSHVVRDHASGYSPAGSDDFRIDMTTLDLVGDGGVLTTIEDLAKWDGTWLEAALPDSPSMVPALLERAVLTTGDTIDYALGVAHGTYRGLSTVGHGGAFVGFRAQYLRFPTEQTGIAVLCNVSTANARQLTLNVADIILEDRLLPVQDETVPIPTVPAGRSVRDNTTVRPLRDLSEYAGVYYSAELDVSYRLAAESGQLRLQIGTALETALDTEGIDVFRARNAGFTIRFVRTNDAPVFTFLLDAGRVKNLRFNRVVSREG